MHYLLFYQTADDYMERRSDFRPQHLKLAWEARARGEIVLAGVLADPPDLTLFLFQGSSPEAAEAFAADDPYVTNGLVTKWWVRRWNTVVGDLADTPVWPEDA